MPQSIRDLQFEHQTMGRLLDIMEDRVGDFGVRQTPDYQLLQVIADYLLSYPDEVHHPKEDLIFSKLQHRDSGAASKFRRLLDEHRELRRITQEFAAVVGDSTEPTASRPEQIFQATRRLVDYYRHHIEMEEKHFFPTAERVLTRDDWAKIDSALTEKIDPLLDEAETKYKNLRATIFRINKESQEQYVAETHSTKDNAALTQLHDLSQFSRLMAERGIDAKLEYIAGDGYQLIIGKKNIVEIPHCSESRAMWCAFYYLKGKGL